MFRFFPPMRDPRAALFGLTLFSNPDLERNLDLFANILETTRKSIAVIRGEMQTFETSMHSLMLPPKEDMATKPVEIPVEQETVTNYYHQNYNQNYTPNYTQSPTQPQEEAPLQPPEQFPYEQPVTTMEVKEDPTSEINEPLERYYEEKSGKWESFLEELQQLVDKYSRM